MKAILTALTILLIQSCFSQDIPTSHTDSSGNLFWRKSTPVYLFVSDSPEGNAQRLNSKKTPKYADPFYLDTEGINYIRTRNAVDPESGKIIQNTEVMFEIYADGLAPTTTINYKDDGKYVDSNNVYYKSGLKITLSSKDGLSGVRKLKYSVNRKDFREYSEAIAFENEGKFELNTFAEDKVGNVEKTKSSSFIIDGSSPFTKLNINGITEKKAISSNAKMYLISYDSISGVDDVYYKVDDDDFVKHTKNVIPFSHLEEGNHTISFYSVDNVGNHEAENNFTFFYDKSPPLMVSDVLGDRFVVGDQVYFSGRTKLKLTAVDNKVGVKNIMFSIDNDEFSQYSNPFYLPSVSGVHTIKFYSVDNLNNSTMDSREGEHLGKGGFEEFKHNVSKFYVDLTGPIIKHQISEYSYIREDTLYIGPYSKIKLIGDDPESGLKSLSYSINNQVGEIEYTEAFSLSQEGYTELFYYGYDQVNNRNVNNFNFFLEATSPEIFIQFSTGSTSIKVDMPVYPQTSGIFLSATDKISGVSNLYYTLDENPEKTYVGLINNLRKGKHKLMVRAVDQLNNEAIKEVEFWIR